MRFALKQRQMGREYVPAYSTRLKYESGVWNVLPSNSSDIMGVVDPVWTESNWNSIVLQMPGLLASYFTTRIMAEGVDCISYVGIANCLFF
ncbi:hypothetical protein PIB30_035541 [Stylosanthes scabra]|uniref:Uncharacterized protein n=1 Tax=Stylosanthes scabra TaxID=79078 RepID=A0ABU6RDY6_9FABA|nr:hypothetical protein [Stylosanthes scabra]